MTLYGINEQTFGMFKVDSIEGPQVESLAVWSFTMFHLQDLKSQFFSDLTATVDYVYNAING